MMLKRIMVGVLGAIVVLAVLGHLVGDSDDDTTANSSPSTTVSTSESPTPTESPTPVPDVEVPDMTGMPADTARNALEDAGFTVTLDGGDKTVLRASNWTVDYQSPGGGETVTSGSEITLYVSKHGSDSDDVEEPADTTPTATSGGITSIDAWTACRIQADREYPYGVKMHSIIGVYADEYVDSLDEWYIKVDTDITNMYGATASYDLECHVTGTPSAPVVEILVY